MLGNTEEASGSEPGPLGPNYFGGQKRIFFSYLRNEIKTRPEEDRTFRLSQRPSKKTKMQPQYVPQYMPQQVAQVPQVQVQQAAPAVAKKPEEPGKARGSRKPWDANRYEITMKALASSAKAIGNSFTHPAQPAQVPKHAPDTSEWNSIATRLMATVPEYSKLLDDRKSVGQVKKAHNGGLEQHVYLTREMTNFLNTCGILTGLITVRDPQGIAVPDHTKPMLNVQGAPILDEKGQPTFHPLRQAAQYSFPVDVAAGGLGITTRAILTSVFSAYTEKRQLKHPQQRRYNMRDADLARFFTDQIMEAVRSAPPKAPKKRKEGAKPKKETGPKIAILQRNNQEIPHFSFDAIPSLTNYYILPVIPRQVTAEQKAQVDDIRKFLHEETEGRKANKKASDAAERDAKKAQKLQNAVVPTTVPTLTLQQPIMAAVGGGPGLQGYVPQAVPSYVAQPGQVQQLAGNTPQGFAVTPGVTFVPAHN